jgi:tRNA A37 threonylcarbamoyladenosine synthetase subunit TsaC/SUA5/YrdC
MKTCETEITSIKRLRKDGELPQDLADSVAHTLFEGGVVLMPVDFIYGIVCSQPHLVQRAIVKSGHFRSEITALISSYKLLNDLAMYSKSNYDFLNRIWPGEVSVYLKSVRSDAGKVKVRFPRSRFLQNILSKEENIFYYAPVMLSETEHLYRKKTIVSSFSGIVDKILIIDELCKKHPLPSVVDISSDDLEIVYAGRVAAEEIKSLYFLGKADE